MLHFFIHVKFLGENKVEHNEKKIQESVNEAFGKLLFNQKHKPLIYEDCRHIGMQLQILASELAKKLLIHDHHIVGGINQVCNSFLIHITYAV